MREAEISSHGSNDFNIDENLCEKEKVFEMHFTQKTTYNQGWQEQDSKRGGYTETQNKYQEVILAFITEE